VDQVDTIIVQFKNAEKIAELTKDLQQQEASLKSLAEQYQANSIGISAYTASARPFAEKAADLTNQIKKLEGETKGLGRATLELGRITQDFAQGGVGGILNNIEGLVTAIGGPAGLAGALTAAGVAAYVATPIINNWWKAWQEGANEVPKGAQGVVGFNDALTESKKRLKELADQQVLTNVELAEFNKLNAQVVAAENEKAAASVKGKDSEETEGFRKALEAFGGGKALIDAIGGTDAGRRAGVAEDIKNALGGNQQSIGFLKGSNQQFDRLLNQFDPETIADDRFKQQQAEWENRLAIANNEKAQRDARQAKNAEVDATVKQSMDASKAIQIDTPEDKVKMNQRVRDARDSADIRRIAQGQFGYNPGEEMGDILKNARQYVGAGVNPGDAARAAIREMLGTMRKLQQDASAMNGFWNQVRQEARTTRTRLPRGT